MIHELLDNSALTIVMDRAEKKNALVPKMYNDMAIAIENASLSGVKVIVIKGAGGCFTAGNDVTEFLRSVQEKPGEIKDTYRFMKALLHCPLPVIAQVEGLAIGIDSTMLLHCDFVLCHKNTRFSMPFINLGLVPEYASSYIIPRVAGHLMAAELLMLGNSFDAKQAQRCGFVTSVHTSDLEVAVSDIAEALAKKPTFALQQTKALLKQDSTNIAQHIDDELEIFVKAMQSEAATEAFTAFVEKRALNYGKFK